MRCEDCKTFIMISVTDTKHRNFCGSQCRDRYAEKRGEYVEPRQLQMVLPPIALKPGY